ncbi:MAG TPA: family 20 glycosylhydrolase [Candidatus Bathyarchaeia archaeon]|nr:family 20 glycosylhydrolase [Candidatus Bathyarchaeia archaeon]
MSSAILSRLALSLLTVAAGLACGRGPASPSASAPKVRGFHIDMNIAQFRGPYLRSWLKRLAAAGYNTVLWEVENNIRWESCPECVSPDAFSKEEFKDILAYSRSLGLEVVPLLQTIGHCEYVLKHPAYKALAEVPDRIDQYCPRNPDVAAFLKKWIDEYLEVFGPVRTFHLGADEAYTLGECPRCRAYAAEHSLSELYIDHINALSQALIEKGIRPAIWGDMILHHPEALDKLSRRIVVYDWLYDRYQGCGTVQIWGRGSLAPGEIDAASLTRFGRFIFPLGDEPGRDPDPFYTADYLAANGFDVVVCPSSSCYGDSVFAPRTYFHMRNTADSFRKGSAAGLGGAVLTSWTVHLFPWELQLPSIELPGFLVRDPGASLQDFEKDYVRRHFGIDDPGFFEAAGLLSRRGLFNYAADMGFFKDARPAPLDYIQKRVEEMAKNGEIEKELAACGLRSAEYERGLEMLTAYDKKAKSGHEELGAWILAGRNLLFRAGASGLLLRAARGQSQAARADGVADLIGAAQADDARLLLATTRALRDETEAAVAAGIKPSRTAEIMSWMYDSMEAALSRLAAGASASEKK